MKTLKVFVLTQHGRDSQGQDSMEIIGVFSAKTKAKERMKERQKEILDSYEEDHPGEYSQYEEGFGVTWGVSCDNAPVFDELLITEKEVNND